MPCVVAIAPVIPQITDHELEAIVEAAAEAGARGGFYLPVRLPHEVAPLFRDWLRRAFSRPRGQGDERHPIDARRARQRPQFLFSRMRGTGAWADLLSTRFEIAAKKHGLRQAKFPLRTDLFEPPPGRPAAAAVNFSTVGG